jgi:hypothetical protein
LAHGHADGADERQQQAANRFQLHGNSTLPCSTVRGFGRSSFVRTGAMDSQSLKSYGLPAISRKTDLDRPACSWGLRGAARGGSAIYYRSRHAGPVRAGD